MGKSNRWRNLCSLSFIQLRAHVLLHWIILLKRRLVANWSAFYTAMLHCCWGNNATLLLRQQCSIAEVSTWAIKRGWMLEFKTALMIVVLPIVTLCMYLQYTCRYIRSSWRPNKTSVYVHRPSIWLRMCNFCFYFLYTERWRQLYCLSWVRRPTKLHSSYNPMFTLQLSWWSHGSQEPKFYFLMAQNMISARGL